MHAAGLEDLRGKHTRCSNSHLFSSLEKSIGDDRLVHFFLKDFIEASSTELQMQQN